MIAISLVIAIPISRWLQNAWLEDFAYRIDIGWWMFGVVGMAALAVALLTVSFQVLRAARVNPVESLHAD